jgi:parallel beta-helix repeat protein
MNKEATMFQKWTHYALIVASAIFVDLGFYSVSEAGNCGGSVPCSCGDTVVASRTLASGDPVVTTSCSGNGLIMNTAGVVLNLNGNKIRGQGSGVGVLINDGVDNVTVENGGVDNFETGIGTAGVTTGTTIDRIRPNANKGDGIFIQGDNNELTGILAKRNGGNGVTVIGNDNFLSGHNDEYNGFDGIHVEGVDNTLTNNLASENAKKGTGNGMTVIGDSNHLQGNRITKLNIDGIVVLGNENTLVGNKATKQRGDGIIVEGNNNELTNNNATANRGVGIFVDGIGNAELSSGNTVSANGGDPQCSIDGETGPPQCKQG